jgi:hypothetical protein
MLEENTVLTTKQYLYPEPVVTLLHTYEIVDEVIVNGITYKRISFGNCLVREENGIVYKYNETLNTDEVFYDFTLEVGDTFTFPETCVLGGSDYYDTIEVSNVYFAVIANENRKVIDFQNEFGETETWIEGIGSLNGFEPGGIYVDGYMTLICFTQNGNTHYFNGANSCVLGIDDFYLDQIMVTPNPVTTTSILQIPAEAAVDQIKIYNFSGKLLMDETISEEFVTINRVDYSSGLYFYQVFSDNKLLKTDKFIVQ